MLPRVRRLALVIALALGSAGCGGEGGGERLTAQEFRDQANRICTDLDKELEGLGDPGSLDELSTQLEAGREIFEDALGQLRGLRPPEDLQADYDRLLATGDDALEALSSMQEAAEDGDAEEVQQIATEAEREDQTSDEIAQGLGLDACATD